MGSMSEFKFKPGEKVQVVSLNSSDPETYKLGNTYTIDHGYIGHQSGKNLYECKGKEKAVYEEDIELSAENGWD